MLVYEDISTWLSAAGANSSPKGEGNNLILLDGGTMHIQQWNSDGLSKKSPITKSAKSTSPAALISDNKVFAIDATNKLRCYIKPPDVEGADQMWHEQTLGVGNIEVHPNSQLCALEISPRTVVIYQDTNGSLGIMQGIDNDWEFVRLPAHDVQLGTPLAFFPFKGCDNIFYIGSDDKVHRFTRNKAEMEWKGIFTTYYLNPDPSPVPPPTRTNLGLFLDEIFSAAVLQDTPSKIVVLPGQEDDAPVLHLFGLCGNKLVLVTESLGDPEVIGMIRNGKFFMAKCLIASGLLTSLLGNVCGAVGGAVSGAVSGAIGGGWGTSSKAELMMPGEIFSRVELHSESIF
ncbi:hypothetical protein O1611_g1932 [Lasiodiplodia mahajangana]|uniref:Uncharacterized protein n=1 Tax=Lasiodiplodia mahajangana TaxID=1108764 RepID=A0ACC2JWA3_9PEZI|nr:hypothetical protein O1611_g1932 [Lasiodiplodia mahajangana]